MQTNPNLKKDWDLPSQKKFELWFQPHSGSSVPHSHPAAVGQIPFGFWAVKTPIRGGPSPLNSCALSRGHRFLQQTSLSSLLVPQEERTKLSEGSPILLQRWITRFWINFEIYRAKIQNVPGIGKQYISVCSRCTRSFKRLSSSLHATVPCGHGY